MATAKSIAAGLPLSAIVACKEIMEAVKTGTIGGTFGGNALACAAACKTIEVMQREHLAERSLAIGRKVKDRFITWQKKYDCIGDMRGLGGMIGIEFVTDKESKTPNPALVTKLIQEAVQRGLMLENAGTYGNVIRFLAPPVMVDEQLEAVFAVFEKALSPARKEQAVLIAKCIPVVYNK